MRNRILFLLLAATCLAVSAFSIIRSGGDIVNHTSSPADGMADCTGCHSGGSVVSAVSVTANPALGPGNTYTPGTTYTFSLTVTGYPYFGFDLEMLDGQLSTSVDAGTIVSAISSCKITRADPYPTNLTHTSPLVSGTLAQWTWRAPASGPVYIYAAGLGVNLDAKTSGDRVADFSMVLSPLTTGIEVSKSSETNFSLFPNPMSDHFSLTYQLDKPSLVSIQILDLSGRVVETVLTKRQDEGKQIFNGIIPATLSTGIYLLSLNVNENAIVKQIVVK